MPICPKCGNLVNGYMARFLEQSGEHVGVCFQCSELVAPLPIIIIQGSAPPFVPMSYKPVPIYWSERLGGWDIFPLDPVPDDMELCAYHWMIEAYETRLAHLCGLIVRRRERQIHNYLVREPIADFNRVIDWVRYRIQAGISSLNKALDVRFTLHAMRDGAESHIYQPKFTALRGAALRGKA